MASEYIVDVSESDFEEQVLAYSESVPVLVDFWAEWCVPCKVLSPILEKLAEEGDGTFRLAKVNVDQNQNLARQFRVTGIPAVKAIRDGRVVAELTGAQPEPKVRDFLRLVIPSEIDLLMAKGTSLMHDEQLYPAEEVFRQILEEMPDHPGARLALSKSLLRQGLIEEAEENLNHFPASREYTDAETLRPLVRLLRQYERGTSLEDPSEPLDAAYARIFRLILRGNLEAAMDGILDVLRQDKRYRSGEPRHVMLGLLELYEPDDATAREYRQELASVLFS